MKERRLKSEFAFFQSSSRFIVTGLCHRRTHKLKVFSRFLAMAEIDFWCIHAWDKQSHKMATTLIYPAKTSISPRSSSLGTFHTEELLRLSDRNSILMVKNLSRIRSEALIGRRSSYIVLAIVYEWQTKDKRPQRSNVHVNTKNL